MRYCEESGVVEISVAQLCAIALRSGHLDGGGITGQESSRIGEAVYRKARADAGMPYTPEVPLLFHAELQDMAIEVSGVADGVFVRDGVRFVDVIRTVRHVDFMAPPSETLLAQLRTFALLLAIEEELETVGGRLVYVSGDCKRIRYFHYTFTAEQLHRDVEPLLHRVLPRARLMREHVRDRLPTAESVPFPYASLREGQEIMIRECFGAIRNRQRLFVEAPTGTGKTVSALYPAVRAVGRGLADKVFYLTAKSSTRKEAFAAAKKLYEAGAHLRTVTILAKEQACCCGARLSGKQGNLCNHRDCELARGYYDRAEAALMELLGCASGYTPSLIRQVALKHHVCPYELSLDLSELCDIIICDYNYVFDPSVYFRRYFAADAPQRNYVFLIDEAHNLADRARDMYSAVLCRKDFEAVYSAVPASDTALNEPLEKIILSARTLRRLCRDNLTKDADGAERGFYLGHQLPQEFMNELELFRRRMGEWLLKNREHPQYEAVDRLLTQVRRFLLIAEYFDERFLFYLEIAGNDMLLKAYCLDPSHIMNTVLSRAKASVLFSATLTPTEYFVDVLGGGEEAVCVSLPSPFDPDRLCLAAVDYLSMRYEDRKKNAMRYASVIAATASAKPGNYIAYFPSYAVLQEVLGAFTRKYPQVKTVVQKRDMNYREKEEFLNAFRDDVGKLRIGFCVLGGLFSEGVDLPGSRLIGSIVFGVGLPGLSNERNIMRDYYQLQNESGYAYAYTYPGMNNVLQAAGRVIRRAEDRGVVVLVDDRYATETYRHLFPDHWRGLQYAGNLQSLAEIVRRFWNNPNNIE